MRRTPFHDAPWELPQFAYGVNTNIDHLRSRCPEWAPRFEPATLSGYRMRFDKAYPGAGTSFCNIHLDPDSTVFGVLLWLDRDSFRRVDRFEGFPIHYHRELVVANDVNGTEVLAWAYVSGHTDRALAPSRHYLEAVLAGLRERQAPEAYLSEVLATIPKPRPRKVRVASRTLARAGR